MSKIDNVFNKIEEIRHQPEHIRLRWVWGLTFASMFLVFIIWMLSIASIQNTSKKQEVFNTQQDLFNEFQTQKESIKDSAGEIKDMLDKSKSLENQGDLIPENPEDLENEGFIEK